MNAPTLQPLVRPMMMIPPPQSMPSIPPPQPMDMDDQPSSKRLRTEETLIPEADFLAQHASKGPVSFSVQIPSVSEKPEWNLKGQLIPFSMPLTETVSLLKKYYIHVQNKHKQQYLYRFKVLSIKNKLMEYLTMPIAKQKLQLDVSLNMFRISNEV